MNYKEEFEKNIDFTKLLYTKEIVRESSYYTGLYSEWLESKLKEKDDKIKQLQKDKAELLEMIKSIPCTCSEEYTNRGRTWPFCAKCNCVDEDIIKRMEGEK